MTKVYHDSEAMVHLLIPMSMYGAVCALLGGASSAAVAVGTTSPAKALADKQPVAAVEEKAAPVADVGESEVGNVLDADGHPWSAALHASTKATTGAGLWRMKPGASRPAPMPGFPKETGGTGTGTGTSVPATGASDGNTAAPASAGPATGDDDDEFAAFAAAAGNSTATAAPARKWTIEDLSKLTNQAAVKLGDPAPVKAIIAEHVPAGEVPHSRNIPEANRAAFAAAIEAKAGITFEG